MRLLSKTHDESRGIQFSSRISDSMNKWHARGLVVTWWDRREILLSALWFGEWIRQFGLALHRQATKTLAVNRSIHKSRIRSTTGEGKYL